MVEHPVAKCRHLDVTFSDNGDVGYCYYRHNFSVWRRFVVEFPFDSVFLVNEGELVASGCIKSRTHEGWLLLEWPKDASGNGDLAIRYEKRGMLTTFRDDEQRHRWKYEEAFRIKASPEESEVFYLQLHGPGRRFSAVARNAEAWFHPSNGERQYFSPRQLAAATFDCSGSLKVDWVLEVDSSVDVSAWPPTRAMPSDPGALDRSGD